MRKDEAPAKAVSKPKKELTRTTAEEEAPAKLATKPATKPKRESTWTAEDENYSKLEAENAFLKQHLVGLQTNSKEVWGKEAEFTERIRILEESVEDERKEREQLDTENRELKGKIAALKRQVLKEANRAALVPKIVANRVPASVEVWSTIMFKY
ncbi:hypothetical protein BC829DRAFT_290967 [Chytridium lagenaria]|nr:hypothetical protein BC829DRAFT_290967 [Chytridium lagenaria]